jgi:hypothetical protein
MGCHLLVASQDVPQGRIIKGIINRYYLTPGITKNGIHTFFEQTFDK